MNYEELRSFLLTKMRLSHIYQPLMVKTLIETGGTATIRQLATTFLSQDESQIMYYEKRLKEMPIRVLSKHEVITKQGELVTLNVSTLTLAQKAEIKRICEDKIQSYVVARGLGIWDYRLLDQSPVPDLLRYNILKEASGRCALCGATNKETILDVDHIIPRSKGGKTEYKNLQVLCAKCNRSKGNRDQSDLRALGKSINKPACIFCNIPTDRPILDKNEYCFSFLDGYPVTDGHTLIVPKRHITDYFEMFSAELNAINELLRIRRKEILSQDETVKGFNVGVNIGQCAGQTVEHCHVHLIPRRKGDTPSPKGGVRGVIPSKQCY